MRIFQRQQGVALITVLLVTAVAAVIASEVVSRLYFHIQRNQAQQAQAQAYQYALGGEELVRQLLREDHKENEFDHRKDRWANLKPIYEFDQGQLKIQVQDLNARLNINSLLSPNGEPDEVIQQQFKELFNSLNLDQQQLDALLDWLDKDSLPKGLGNEDDHYLSLESPYRTANQPLVHLSELLLLEGWKPKHLALIAPHVSALASNTSINVNTASAPVLATLGKGLSAEDATSIVINQQTGGFDSLATFLAHNQLAGIEVNSSLASVKSDYFLVYIESTFADSRIRLQSILYRDISSGDISLVSRDRNSRFLWPKQENEEKNSQ